MTMIENPADLRAQEVEEKIFKSDQRRHFVKRAGDVLKGRFIVSVPSWPERRYELDDPCVTFNVVLCTAVQLSIFADSLRSTDINFEVRLHLVDRDGKEKVLFMSLADVKELASWGEVARPLLEERWIVIR